MSPELILAINSAIAENGTIVAAIIRKAKETHRFRDKCDALAKDAKTLQKVLEKYKNIGFSLEILGDLEGCLKSVETFVAKVEAWSAFQVGLDVFVKKRFPELKLKVKTVLEQFMFEVDVSLVLVVLFKVLY